jgi:hypothetical protein
VTSGSPPRLRDSSPRCKGNSSKVSTIRNRAPQSVLGHLAWRSGDPERSRGGSEALHSQVRGEVELAGSPIGRATYRAWRRPSTSSVPSWYGARSRFDFALRVPQGPERVAQGWYVTLPFDFAHGPERESRGGFSVKRTHKPQP